MNASQTLSKKLSNSGIKVEVEYCRATQTYNGWATLNNGQEIYLAYVPRNIEAAELRIADTVLLNAK